MQDAIQVGRGSFMHDHADRQTLFKQAMRAQNFKTAQMGAEQDASASRFDKLIEHGGAFDLKLEIPVASGEQVDPVVDRRGKRVIMAKHIPPCGRPAECPLQIPTRHAPGTSGKHNEVETNGIEKPSRERTADQQGHPRQKTEEDHTAALWFPQPFAAHGPTDATGEP